MPMWRGHSDRDAVKVSLALSQEFIPVLRWALGVDQTEQQHFAYCRQRSSHLPIADSWP